MVNGFAFLPMYDFAALRPAHDAFWQAVAVHAGLASAGRAPPLLHEDGSEALAAFYARPGLILGQTCGLPLTTTLAALRLTVVATPVYTAPGCDGPTHRSVIVVRRGGPIGTLADARGARAAINGVDSNTGMNLFRAAIAPLAGGKPFFGDIVVTGAHAASLEAVAGGRADIAAIDCVTFALLGRLAPDLVARVGVIAETEACPALPLVAPRAAGAARIAALRRALAAVASDPAARPALDALLIARFAVLPDDAYGRVTALAARAQALCYPELA